MSGTHPCSSFPLTRISVSIILLLKLIFGVQLTFFIYYFHTHICTIIINLVRMESSANCPVSREAGGTCSMPKFESTWGVSELMLKISVCSIDGREFHNNVII